MALENPCSLLLVRAIIPCPENGLAVGVRTGLAVRGSRGHQGNRRDSGTIPRYWNLPFSPCVRTALYRQGGLNPIELFTILLYMIELRKKGSDRWVVRGNPLLAATVFSPAAPTAALSVVHRGGFLQA